MKEKMKKVTVPPTPPETRIITRAIIRLCMNASFGRDAPEDYGTLLQNASYSQIIYQ